MRPSSGKPAWSSKWSADSNAPPDPASQARVRSGPPAIALVGNPNTGKTTLFNSLTGFRRHVANYPGVTVDVGRGPIRGANRPLELLDLPGTYSLSAASPDEAIVWRTLYGRIPGQARPRAILTIVDASNPLRNFYLVSQLLEVGLPVVVALNMIDVAAARGLRIDAEGLSRHLGVPVVPVVATRARTVAALVGALEEAIRSRAPAPGVELPEFLRREAAQLAEQSAVRLDPGEALRILVDQGGYAERDFLARGGSSSLLEQSRQRLTASGLDPAAAEIRARYDWVNRLLDGLIEREPPSDHSWSTHIDHLLTHRVSGILLLLLVLYGIFCAVYLGARPAIEAVEVCLGWVEAQAVRFLPEGALRSLITAGVLAGVGSVLAFMPQILVLFLFLAILEDCGYLARAAFMVDRLMRPLGLSGRAFIPLLSSFACAVPAIMGTRTIADRRERFLTIFIAPFMSCSARLPVYSLLISALLPTRTWLGGWLRLDSLVMLAMYLVGIVAAIPAALVLRRTVLAGPPTPFLLELPSYKWPRVRTVVQRVYLAGRRFLTRAGTVILLVNLIVWALGYFPRRPTVLDDLRQREQLAGWDRETFESELAAAYLRDSCLGRLGRSLEPVIEPLGWDWRIGVSVLAAFPARELVIATLGTVFNLGLGPDANSAGLRARVAQVTWEHSQRPLFTLPVGLSLMVFFALCAQCTGTLVVIARETGSWVWPLGSFVGMTGMAYLAAWAVFAGTRALGW